MKNILFTLIALIFFAVPVFSQNSKKTRSKVRTKTSASKPAPIIDDAAAPPPPAAKRAVEADDDTPPPPPPVKSAIKKRKAASSVLNDESIGKWGVASLLIPDDLVNKQNSQEEKINKNVGWTVLSRSWKQAAEYNPSALEVDLTVTTWNNPITEVIPDLRPELATPENLVLLDLIGDENTKNKPNSRIKESNALEIANLKGAFFRADSPVEPNQFMVGWGTYRYYNGKLQNILLTITGDKDELEKALKILRSLKLE